MIRSFYLLQSYEEVPFLMYLISLKKSEETITVLNYGNADLKQHLSNLTKKYNISLINNTLENKRNFSNELIYILSYLKFFIKHLYILMSLLKSQKNYIFLLLS